MTVVGVFPIHELIEVCHCQITNLLTTYQLDRYLINWQMIGYMPKINRKFYNYLKFYFLVHHLYSIYVYNCYHRNFKTKQNTIRYPNNSLLLSKLFIFNFCFLDFNFRSGRTYGSIWGILWAHYVCWK